MKSHESQQVFTLQRPTPTNMFYLAQTGDFGPTNINIPNPFGHYSQQQRVSKKSERSRSRDASGGKRQTILQKNRKGSRS
jgi:hypothetical protein